MTIFGHYTQFFIPTCRFRILAILASRMPYWSSKMAKSRELEIFSSEIKNMDHKLSNDVSNVFIRHVVQILSHFEIFSKHVILTRKRGDVKKKTLQFWSSLAASLRLHISVCYMVQFSKYCMNKYERYWERPPERRSEAASFLWGEFFKIFDA